LGDFDEAGSERYSTFFENFSASNEELSKYARDIHGIVSVAVLEVHAGLVRFGSRSLFEFVRGQSFVVFVHCFKLARELRVDETFDIVIRRFEKYRPTSL
jgi:hypothetical protein